MPAKPRPVIVTVEARPVATTLWGVYCSRCGKSKPYRTRREAEQWAQHHRMTAHPDAYT
jgi:hypothetical protein